MAVTNQELFNIFLANPNMSDAQIVSLMEQRGISPAQVSQTFGIPIAEIESRYNAALPFVNPEIEERVVDMGEGTRSEYYIKGTNIQADAPTFTETSPTTGLTESSAPQLQANNFTVYDPQAKGEYVYSPEGKLIGFNPGERGSGFGSLLNEVYQDNKGVIIPALTLGALNAYGLLGGGAAAGGAEAATAFDLANAGIAGGSSGFTAAELAAIEGGRDLATAGLLSGGKTAAQLAAEQLAFETQNAGASALTNLDAASKTGMLTGAKTAAELATEKAAADAAVKATGALTAEELAKKAATSAVVNELAKKTADTASGLLQTGGSLLQSQVSKEAAQKAAQDTLKATQTAQEAAQFRPVGMTTRFGTSNYTYDPVTGRMTSAGYQLSPEAKAAQDRLVGLAGRGLTQAEQAQAQFAPLQTGAQNLFGLGNQYISQSPQDVAQNYLNQQMALLQPGREVELANLQNRLFQQGRTGVSVAQGGSMGATTPELQALYNARAQQEAQLAANAQQFGQQNTLFGANLLTQGANAMGQYYGGQQAAYSPYTTALGQVQALEGAAQQPLQMGANLAQQASAAGARSGALGLEGTNIASKYLTGNDATFNPYASLFTAAGNPNSMFGQSIAKYIAGTTATPYDALSSAKYGDGLAGYQKMIEDIYGS